MALVDRVKNILLSPQTEWPKIAAEESNVQSIMVGYVLILAAIGPIALAIRLGTFGIAAAVFTYVTSLVTLFVIAFIIDFLAPNFGGEKNFVQSLKLIAYASTATWVAAILNIVPYISMIVSLLALVYALYTFYLGAPVLKKCAADKAVGFTVVVIVCWIVLAMVLGAMLMPMVVGGRMAGLGMMQ